MWATGSRARGLAEVARPALGYYVEQLVDETVVLESRQLRTVAAQAGRRESDESGAEDSFQKPEAAIELRIAY